MAGIALDIKSTVFVCQCDGGKGKDNQCSQNFFHDLILNNWIENY